MKSALKTIYTAMTGMLIAVTGQVNGADFTPPPNFNPSCNTPNSGLIFYGELLYLRPQLCGLESAFGDTVIATSVAGGIITTTVNESDREPTFNWNTGYRVGAELVINCVDIDASWTHFNGGADYRDGLQYGNWKIEYEVFDLTFGRFWQAAPSFYFKPFIGLRVASIDQSLKSHLTTLFTALIGNNTVSSDLNDKEDFWGIGPQVGIEADWQLGYNLSLYGSFDIVTYYGEVKGKSFDVDTFTSTVSVGNGRRKHCFNKFATDGTLGIRWDQCFNICCYNVNVMLKVGAEQHRIYDFSNLGSDGALSIDGGTFGAGIGFCF